MTAGCGSRQMLALWQEANRSEQRSGQEVYFQFLGRLRLVYFKLLYCLLFEISCTVGLVVRLTFTWLTILTIESALIIFSHIPPYQITLSAMKYYMFSDL